MTLTEAQDRVRYARFDSAKSRNFPEKLCGYSSFVAWKEAPPLGKNSKPRKVPVNPMTLANASTADPSTWATKEHALTAVSKNLHLMGPGFVFSEADPFAGLDLDNCRNSETGALEQWAEDLVRQIDSYAEISPSQRGVKIFIEADLGGRGGAFFFQEHRIEIYDRGRYFALTGERLDIASGEIWNRQAALDLLFPPDPQVDPLGAPLPEILRDGDPLAKRVDAIPDAELFRRIKSSAQGAKFTELMEDSPSHDGHYFAAAESLCSILGFWTRAEPQRIDRLFRTSRIVAGSEWEGRWWDAPHCGGRKTLGQYIVERACTLVRKGEMYLPPEARELETIIVRERFSDITAKPVEWDWPDRIPRAKLTIFSGDPDQGKSTVGLDVVARRTTKSPWPDGAANEAEPGDVLMLIAEDDPEDTVKPRLLAAGADVNRVHLLRCVRVTQNAKKTERMLALDTDLALLEAELKGNPEIKLVVIDPITNYFGRANSNRDQELRSVLVPIKEVAERTGVTFIGIGHFNKRSDVNALHRVGGAVAMSGVARAVWMFMKNPEVDGEYLMLLGKGNLTKKRTGLRYRIVEKMVTLPGGTQTGVPVIDWQAGEATASAEATLSTMNDPAGRKIAKAKRFLTDFLVHGDKPSDEVIAKGKEAGLSRNTLFDAKKVLDIAAYKQGRAWWWSSPKPDPANPAAREPGDED